MINLFVFTGRVASSVKFKYRENGEAFARFVMAVPRVSNKEMVPDFLTISVFGKLAEACNNNWICRITRRQIQRHCQRLPTIWIRLMWKISLMMIFLGDGKESLTWNQDKGNGLQIMQKGQRNMVCHIPTHVSRLNNIELIGISRVCNFHEFMVQYEHLVSAKART